MKGWIKVGAGIALALLAAPMLLAISRNPFLVIPTWLIIVYVGASQLLPAERKPVAALASVVGAQLSWRVLYIVVVAVELWPATLTAALALALVWLLLKGSRWAAAAIIVVELVGFALVVPAVTGLLEDIRAYGLYDLIPSIVALYVCPAAAMGLAGPLTAARERRADETVAVVFD